MRHGESRVFASARDETRVTRPADAAQLVLAVIVTALAAWANDGSDLEAWVADIVDGAPEWIRALATAGFSVTGMALLGLVVLVVANSRWALVRDTLAAVGVTVVGALVLTRWVSGGWPDLLPEFEGGPPEFPVLRISLVTSVFLTVRQSLTAPVRRAGRWVIGVAAVSALVLEFGSLTTVIGGVALGVGAAAVVRLVFGTSIGIPSLARVSSALEDLNVHVHGLAYDEVQPRECLRATASDADGPVAITIYGRDAADSAFASRLWRAMWYRDAAWSIGVSRVQLAEHEALLLLLAARAGVHVPDVVAVGATSTGDVLLVTRDVGRTALSDVGSAPVDDDLVDSIWSELRRLHDADISLGRVSRTHITLAPGEAPGFRHLAAAAMSPTPLGRRLDVVELLVTSALLVGQERAVAVAMREPNRDVVADALTTLQPAAISHQLAQEVRAADLDLDELRDRVAAELDVESPEPVQLKRVRLRDVVMVAFALVAANALISWVTSIDVDTLVDEISNASIGWLLMALVLSQATNVAETVSMMGVVSQPIPFGPTMQFQYATSYIGLAVPSDAGRIAMTIRYLQKLGVPTTVAVGQGPFTTVFGYLIDLILLLVTMRVVGTSLELPDDTDFSGFVTVLVVLIIVVVIGLVVVLAVPRFRQRIVPAVKETVAELKGALTEPDRAAKLLGGLVAKKLLFALGMACILAAFHEPLPIATVIFVNTAVSWFAGIMPVPGGIGVAEAGFVVGLTAFGVSEPVALATALTHRLLTSYLPPVAGFFAMRRLERAGYL